MPRGRGASLNPQIRFEKLDLQPDPESYQDRFEGLKTEFLVDHSQSIIAYNDSPDIGFDASINPYRGCEHGCIYCYARPTHEYLGYSAGLDFETRILVKKAAPHLLRRELQARGWKPQVIGLSGVTDPYQPVENRLQLTRSCLRVLADYRNPVIVITKNQMIQRDIDLLQELSRHRAVGVMVSITTLDPKLCNRMEPRASTPERRLQTIRALNDAGIPTGVLVAPVIPGFTQHELPSILKAAADSGASRAGYVVLRLPHSLTTLFEDWLDNHYPTHKDKILRKQAAMRGGKLNNTEFGSRMRGEGIHADQIQALYRMGIAQAGLNTEKFTLSTSAFRRQGETPFLPGFAPE